MTNGIPKIDPREFELLLKEFKALVPYYTSEWNLDTGREYPGAALVKIFLHMLVTIIRQTNRLPGKHFISFLDRIGIRLLPPLPAQVPLTFTLSEGAPEHTLVPEKTQVAAGEVIFETIANILAAPARLQRVYTIDIDKDAVYLPPPHLVSGEPTVGFETTLLHPAIRGDKEIFVVLGEGLAAGDVILLANSEYAVVAEVDGLKVSLAYPLEGGDPGLSKQPTSAILGVEDIYANRMLIAGIATVKDLVAYKDRAAELAVILKGDDTGSGIDYDGAALNILENCENGDLDPDYDDEVNQKIEDGELLPLDTVYTDAGRPVQKITYLKPFDGKDVQEHVLYLGHTTLLEITDPAALILDSDPGFPIDSRLTWEYYGDNDDEVEDWHPLEVRADYRGFPLVLFKNWVGEIKEYEVNGIESRWLRCRLDRSQIADFRDLELDTLQVAAVPMEEPDLPGTNLLPDLVFYNDFPAEPTEISAANPFYPFGKQPAPGATFYLGAKKALSNKGSQIEISFTLLESVDVSNDDILLSWEYWDDEAWMPIEGLVDGTDKLTGNGLVTFTCPDNITALEVNGKENYWIRARLAGGGYGDIVCKLPEGGSDYVPIYQDPTPPAIVALSITYTDTFDPEYDDFDHCLTYNNLEYIDRSKEARQAVKPFNPFYTFSETLRCLYLALDNKPEKGPVSLFFAIDETDLTGTAVPPVDWQYYDEDTTWQSLDFIDGTRGLTRTGAVEFMFPPELIATSKFGYKAYWLRAVERSQSGAPIDATRIDGIFLNTVQARQIQTLSDELLGSGDGTADQSFFVTEIPVIPGTEVVWVNEIKTLSAEEMEDLKAQEEYEIKEVTDENGDVTEFWVHWQRVDQLISAAARQRGYEIDFVTGEITFGNGVYGKILPTGTDNVKADYGSGGGLAGNLSAYDIKDLKTSLAFLDNAVNPLASGGGTEAETVERALQRGPYLLKHRNRAVTAEDYEQLVYQSSQEVARVRCIPNMNSLKQFEPGWVTLVAIPYAQDAKPTLSLQMKQQIEDYLYERTVNVLVPPGHVYVTGPVYVELSIDVVLAAVSLETVPTAEKACLARLEGFLNPLTGGLNGRGWAFGSVPCFSDFYALLEQVEGVDYTVEIFATLTVPGPGDTQASVSLTLDGTGDFRMPPYAVICSGTHQVRLEYFTDA